MVGQKLESTIFDLVKSGVKTKDIGGNVTTEEFTRNITRQSFLTLIRKFIIKDNLILHSKILQYLVLWGT